MMGDENVVFRRVQVTPEHGLHLSPISQLVRKALTFSSTIFLKFDDRKADVKSAFDLMLLAAPSGAILELQASGSDAAEAADAICELFEAGFVISTSEIH
ncbi:MAG TPA: HPr family phosphocarrier protein [Planctomycetaceae bacterium]|nr:HPr family phosphocarrier protein [Planctomycetaceae bacterium]